MSWSPERRVLAVVSFAVAGFIMGLLVSILVAVGQTNVQVILLAFMLPACVVEGVLIWKIDELNEREFRR